MYNIYQCNFGLEEFGDKEKSFINTRNHTENAVTPIPTYG